MSKLNMMDKAVIGIYDVTRSAPYKRRCMFLDLDKYTPSKIGWNFMIREVDYSRDKDFRKKIEVHRKIFNGNYKVDSFIHRLSKSINLITGYSFFMSNVDSFDKVFDDCIVGSMDVLNYKDRYILCNFGILEEYRRFGFGKSSISYLYDVLKRDGIDKLFLFVNDENYIAKEFYSGLGFEYLK